MKLTFLFVRKYKKNRVISEHLHNVYEFVYYFNGTGHATCNNSKSSFYKDSFVIIPPNVQHSETHIGTGHILAIGFSSDKDLTLKNQMYNGFDPKIYSLVQKIKLEFIKKEEYFEDIIETLLNELVLYLQRSQKKETSTNKYQNKDISYAISFLNEYFMTDINLNELAQSAGYCKDHFRVLFKKHTGTSPKKFILHKKLAYSKKLLSNPALSLKDVSANCGFEYYSCFCGFFKKNTKMTPLEFRKQSLPSLDGQVLN